MIYIDSNKKMPLYEQIYHGICRHILEGELEKGSRLKPIRNLARELNVSNNTVSKAYQQLMADGYVKSIPGSGFYVRKIIAAKRKKSVQSEQKKKEQKLYLYDFGYEMVEATNFPWSKWRRYLERAISEEADSASIGYEDKKGSLWLREVLCEYVQETRGIKCQPEQMIICAGKQYAMDIILEILPSDCKKAAVENPSLKRVRKSFLDKEKAVMPISVTKDGLNMAELEASDSNVLYITPSHNFPTGYVTPLTKRVQILEWAKRSESYVIEDDFEHEFFDDMQTIPAIQSMDRNGRVIYMHTLSRVLSPSIRCTYMILPEELLSKYEERYRYYYTALPLHNQRALAGFISDGHLERQARKMRSYNKKKCMKLKEQIEHFLATEAVCHMVSSYNHLLVQIPSCADASALQQMLETYGIHVHTAKEFWVAEEGELEDAFLLGFHAIAEEDLEDACEEFAYVVKEFLKQSSE